MPSGLIENLSQAGFSNHQLKQSDARKLVWSRDASHYRIQPQFTMRAENDEQIAKILKAANDSQTPVTFRSGGSSLSGQTLGRGIVVDTRTGFSKVLATEKNTVTAQPGVTLARLNGHLAKQKSKIGPDPASMIASTIGGAVSNNSSGMTCGTEFNSYATIKSAKIIFADGASFHTAQPDSDAKLKELKPALYEQLELIRDEIRANPEQVEQIRGLFSLKNTMGLSMNAFIDYQKPVDILLHLLVGAEGTLAFLAEVELETFVVKQHKLASLLMFDSLNQANESLVQIINQKPAAIELMDVTSLRALQGESLLPNEIESRLGDQSAAILVEFESDLLEEAQKQAGDFQKLFSEATVYSGESGETRNKLWSLRKGLYAVVAKSRPVGTTAMLEDVVVPPEKLTVACDSLAELCDRFGYGRPVIFGHVRDGNIHFMISDDFSNQARVAVFEKFTKAMVELILSLGGNLKAEHGTGRAMAPFVVDQFGEDLYLKMKRVKLAFDPNGILNPGVIFAATEHEYLENLKQVDTVSEIVDSCVECGYCESSCPSAGLTLTPRERIVAFRELENTTGADRKALLKELDYQVDQTCAVDGMCAVNCPVGINTGTFVKQIRAEKTSAASKAVANAVESNWGTISSLAGAGLKVARKVPWLSKNATQLFRKILPNSTFPQWDSHITSTGFRRSKLKSTPGDYVFLPSCMNEVFGETKLPDLVELAQSVGVGLEIPDGIGDFCCGTPFSSKGFEDATKKREQKNRSMLSHYGNKTLVIDGSSCHQTLLAQSAQPVIELSEFVAEQLLDHVECKKYKKIVIHPTCSGEKTGSNKFMMKIARAIAEEVVIPSDWKCCGFAGDRGLLVPELTENATMLESAEIKDMDAVFVSNNQPCQIGMTSGSGKEYISILQAWKEAQK